MLERILLPLDGSATAEAILELAGRKMADLIAMATHGRSGLSRWFLGRVTEQVLRSAIAPMLIVRARSA